MVERRVVAQLQRVVACDPIGLADLGEQLGLLDRVDTQIGLQVEVQVEQLGRIAGLLGDQRHHPRRQILTRRPTATPRPPRPPVTHRRAGSAAGATGVVAGVRSRTKRDDVVERRVVAQLQRVVACDPIGLTDLGEQLGLLDRVDPQIGLQVEIQSSSSGG